jgi:SHS2 domain-containing protein
MASPNKNYKSTIKATAYNNTSISAPDDWMDGLKGVCLSISF